MVTLFKAFGHDMVLSYTQAGTPIVTSQAIRPAYKTTVWGTLDQLVRYLGHRLDQCPWVETYFGEITEEGREALSGLHHPIIMGDAGKWIACPARLEVAA